MKKILLSLFVLLLFVGCGSSGNKKQSIDMLEYFPSQGINKKYTEFQRINADNSVREYTETVTVEPNLITIKIDDITTEDVVVSNDLLTQNFYGDRNISYTIERHATVGDTISTYTKNTQLEQIKIGAQEIGNKTVDEELSCKLEEVIDQYEISLYEYHNYDGEHNIIKIKCTQKTIVKTEVYPEYLDAVTYESGTVQTANDTFYIYRQKELGTVATINDNCIISKNPDIIDDSKEESKCIGEQYNYLLYNRYNAY